MSSNKIYYYISPSGKNVIREFILSLQKNQQVKVRRILQLINDYGLTSANPHIKKLFGTPFWEIKILGKDNIRILYVALDINSILVLHGFNKKTQKTPMREIQIAINRYSEWQSNH
jgi:phage-related protein